MKLQRLNPDRLAVLAPPLGAAALALVLLTAWTAVGGAGRARAVEAAGPGWVLLPTAGAAPATAAFFTLRNPGDIPDELTSVEWEFGGRLTLKRHVHQGAAGRWEPVPTLPVPPGGELALTPEDADVLIADPPPLTAGRWLEFTLHFRHSPSLRVAAQVLPPGSARPQ